MSEENMNIENEAAAVSAETNDIQAKIAELEAQMAGEQSAQTEAPVERIESTDIDKLVAQRVEEQLTKIKGSLDKAYAERDEAAKRLAAMEEAAKQEKITKLTDEGKHKEVYELKLQELNAKLEAATARNVQLARDMQVRDALKDVDFRNEKASNLAYKSIIDDLIHDPENGEWIHKTGMGIREYVEVFQKEDDNSFLFKPKTNSGAGAAAAAAARAGNANAELAKKRPSEMTQEELLQAAASGLFGEIKSGW